MHTGRSLLAVCSRSHAVASRRRTRIAIVLNPNQQETLMRLISKLLGFFTESQAAAVTVPVPTAQSELAAMPRADHPISAKQIELVQSTWKSVGPISDQAASLFYGKLFELDPDTKLLFAQTEMEEQKKKLMQMISVAVHGLDRLDQIGPAVQELGKRHVSYNVQDDHYDTVGTALLWTLEQGLGNAFTREVQEAWSATYTVLADTMKAAAAEPPVG
jgi:hemoglobin-like flavoprotein